MRTAILVLLMFLLAGCGAARGVVNDSPGLRWWLFSNFGATRLCPEMLKRGAPLALVPNGSTIGRFFPERCAHQLNDASQTITLSFFGTGFAWTPIAGRVTFSAEASIEYRMDFLLAEESMYVWAKTQRLLSGPIFRLGAVENPLVNWAAQSPVGYLANTFGNQIVAGRLAEGFTVVRSSEGDEFALGYLAPPARPPRPFNLKPGRRVVLANESTEVQQGQVDLLGPFEVVEEEQALFLRLISQGPAVDVFVLRRGATDLWRSGWQLGAALGPPPEQPLLAFVLQPGAEARQKVALPRGQYVVVVDNSPNVGMVAPPFNPLGVLGLGVARLSASVELGEQDDRF